MLHDVRREIQCAGLDIDCAGVVEANRYRSRACADALAERAGIREQRIRAVVRAAEVLREHQPVAGGFEHTAGRVLDTARAYAGIGVEVQVAA